MKKLLIFVVIVLLSTIPSLNAGEKLGKNDGLVDAKKKKELISFSRKYFQFLKSAHAADNRREDKKMLDELFPPLI